MAEFGLGLIALLYLLGIVVLICWIILPFALIGTKPLLRQILEQQRETNAYLAVLAKAQSPEATAAISGTKTVPARQITTR